LLGRLAVPRDRQLVVLIHAHASAVHTAKERLEICVPLRRGLAKQLCRHPLVLLKPLLPAVRLYTIYTRVGSGTVASRWTAGVNVPVIGHLEQSRRRPGAGERRRRARELQRGLRGRRRRSRRRKRDADADAGGRLMMAMAIPTARHRLAGCEKNLFVTSGVGGAAAAEAGP